MLDWTETPDEVIILLAVPANAQKHEVNYKLRPTHLAVSVQGVTLIQASLSNPVQPEDSTWQFGKCSCRVWSVVPSSVVSIVHNTECCDPPFYCVVVINRQHNLSVIRGQSMCFVHACFMGNLLDALYARFV